MIFGVFKYSHLFSPGVYIIESNLLIDVEIIWSTVSIVIESNSLIHTGLAVARKPAFPMEPAYSNGPGLGFEPGIDTAAAPILAQHQNQPAHNISTNDCTASIAANTQHQYHD